MDDVPAPLYFSAAIRKRAMIVQQPSLNLPHACWEGAVTTAPGTRSALIAFASCVLHRVTPITRDIRKPVVAWITGPQFR
jgi:hypothetical protein